MKLFFLEASVPLTKTFSKRGTDLIKTPYPFVWEFTSHEESVKDLGTFATLLRSHALAGHCLLKGEIRRPLVRESRAGSTDTNSPTEWAVLDLDGLPESHAGNTLTIDTFLQALGIGDISYIVQWSASYGLESKKIRAHIFFLLDKAYAAPLLKQWLIHTNHTVDLLRSAMQLTKTGNSISWPLDVSACQNDKLIYIAPPVLAKGIKDPVPADKRIALVKRKNERLVIDGKFSSEKNRELTEKRLDELREADGLPKRKHKTRMHGTMEVLVKPDQCTITEMKQERGFVYFNLNGGDSWAYYHPETNPEFILNFKGEPVYLTKELLPDYWSEICSQPTRTSSNGVTHLAFCDTKTAAYYIGRYYADTDVLDLNLAKTPTQVREFAKQVGMPLGDFIPYWDLIFDPHDTTRVDFQNKTINLYAPSEFMKASPPPKPVGAVPKTISKVLNHALGNSPEITEHFLNWCAYIIQKKDRTRTAWVMHGVPGTGKGILMNNILRPIIGAQHTAARRMEELNEQYNHFMKGTFLVFVDEVQTKALQNERGVMAKLKNFITEEMVPIRAMYSNAHEARNYCNWIFASNMPDPVAIDKNDRRFNVAKYQPNKLQISDKEVEMIEKELASFYAYLLHFPLDISKATSVLDTADRTTMIKISESSIDTVSDKLLEGSFEFFMEQLPSHSRYTTDSISLNRLENYKHVLGAMIQRTDPANGKCSISREELRVIYDYVIGGMPTTPNKFTSLLKHHRVHIEKVWLDAKAVNGIKVVWADLPNFPGYTKTLVPAVKPPAQPKLAAANGKKVA